MALVKCSECGKEISTNSEKCIHCGTKLKDEVRTKNVIVDIDTENNNHENKENIIDKYKTITFIISGLIIAIIMVYYYGNTLKGTYTYTSLTATYSIVFARDKTCYYDINFDERVECTYKRNGNSVEVNFEDESNKQYRLENGFLIDLDTENIYRKENYYGND